MTTERVHCYPFPERI